LSHKPPQSPPSDTEGTTWITILLQQMDNSSLDSSLTNVAFIEESQGRLHYVDDYKLSVWILNGNREWIFKYNINTSHLFGAKLSDLGDYSLVAIHPKCNTIIFTAIGDNVLLSLLELCPRGNNKDVIIIILVHDNIYIPC
jgi:hypothetical protein